MEINYFPLLSGQNKNTNQKTSRSGGFLIHLYKSSFYGRVVKVPSVDTASFKAASMDDTT